MREGFEACLDWERALVFRGSGPRRSVRLTGTENENRKLETEIDVLHQDLEAAQKASAQKTRLAPERSRRCVQAAQLGSSGVPVPW